MRIAAQISRHIRMCAGHRDALGHGRCCLSLFGKVAELIGRLSAPSGRLRFSEIHRRMSETHGDEREGTYRMTNMVIPESGWLGCCAAC